MGVRACTVWRRFAWSDVCRPELGRPHRKVGRGSTGTQRYRLHCHCCPFVCCPARCATARARTSSADRRGRGSTGAQRCRLLRPLCPLAPHLCVVRATSAKYTQRGLHHITSLYIYISIYMRRHVNRKCLPKMLSTCTLFRLRAEQNSVDFVVLFLRGSSTFYTFSFNT